MDVDAPFALCLTHDVDRPYKRFAHAVYYAAREPRLGHLTGRLTGRNPYAQFGSLMALEERLGVRSAFYFLNEPPVHAKSPREWLRPRSWVEHLGRYDATNGAVADAIRDLDAGGWEVGLHGSLHSFGNRERLADEKAAIERVLGRRVVGGRQHHLQLDAPETWRDHAAVGLRYDASLGSTTSYGFEHGYGVERPFGDEFVVFPLTLMEQTLPDPGEHFDAAWEACEELLREAAEIGAVMTVLWHLRHFSEEEFPGYRRLYRRLVQRAQEMGAWVGPPAELYDHLEQPSSPTPDP